jgi:surface antigen
MRAKRHWIGLSLAAVLAAGCDQYGTQAEDTGKVEQAVDICNETVPANRIVDGIPAYAQCAAAQNSAIYSNNGVDTATTSGGTGWIRTQYSGGYQCTELAHRYLYFHWNVSWIPNGNAGTWCDTAPPSNSGVVQTTTPVHGDLIVFPPGSCGADATTGHVALVDTVNSATQVTIVEQNSAGRRNCNISCAKCFLHAVANTGTGGSGGASGTGGSATGGAAPSTGGTASPTGGKSAATGGTLAATGGVTTATGGSATGGGPAATGGTASPTGGRSGATGGTPTATGGATTATGGTATTVTGGTATGGVATGGATPSSGGTTAQAGQSTAGTGPDANSPEAGCSCAVPVSTNPRPFGLVALAAVWLLAKRRSRRSRTLERRS